MEKFKSGIFMFAFTTMAFSVACAVALAVALCRTICMGFHISMPCFLGAWFWDELIFQINLP
jgi:hypothetical protein